jgi:cytochrome bd-type quinol oxidase subunit 2
MYVIGNTPILLVTIACIVLVVLLLIVFFRNQAGDQRMIRTTNQMLLPILSAIAITLGLVFGNHTPLANSACSGTFDTLRNVTAILALLLVIIGLIRYALSRPLRDRRLITQPLIIAMILLVLLFFAQNLLGCI